MADSFPWLVVMIEYIDWIKKSEYDPLKDRILILAGKVSWARNFLFRLVPKFGSTLSVCSKKAHIFTTPCLAGSNLYWTI